MAPTQHPADSVLADFILGKLLDRADAEAERHLADCPYCQSRAAAARPDDTLLSLVAAAGTRADAEQSEAPTLPGGLTPAEFTPAEMTRPREWAGGKPRPAAARVGVDAEVPNVLAGHPRYRPVRLLGSGGMGVVWLVEHAVMGRQVALKIIRPGFLARPGAAERFGREVRAAAQLNHPNIAVAYDADEAGGVQFLVMEYVPGETLLEVVKRGPLPVAEACRTARDAARGLAHAHAAGLVHRDVKPGNLIRAAGGAVKILDFGLVAREAEADGLTGENVVVGTPDYIAPEQATDARAGDARSDVYSLGCTLYHLLSGRVPYPSRWAILKLDAHRDLTMSPDPIPGLPERLAAVLAQMLAKNPADRYQTADAAADALNDFCVTLTELPRLALTDVRGQHPRPRYRRRFAVAAGVLAVLAAVAALAVVFKIALDRDVVTVESGDPDIEVAMKRNGELVRILDAMTKQVWEPDARMIRLRPDGGDPQGCDPQVVRRDDDAAVTIRRTPAPDRQALLAVTDFRETLRLVELRGWLDGLAVGFRPIRFSAWAGVFPPRFDFAGAGDAFRYGAVWIEFSPGK